MTTHLTPRQREVLTRIVAGLSNKEIAADLDISLQTAKWHVSRLLAAHGVVSRVALVRMMVLRDAPREAEESRADQDSKPRRAATRTAPQGPQGTQNGAGWNLHA